MSVRRLLNAALHRGGDFADIHLEYSTRNSVVMEDGIIKSSAVAVVSGVGIRVVQDDQTGYAYSEDLKVKPKAGSLIVFPPYYTHAHRGNPLIKGNKYIINTWLKWR